jgi:hypothetical protein
MTRKAAHNRRLAKKRVQCLNEALCLVSSLVLADSLVLRNPLLRQAPKRYGSSTNRINMKHLLLLFSLTCLTMNSIAQSVTVIGTVRDFETNEPLSEAVILEDKTVNGDVIDSLGNFLLNIEGTGKVIKCNFVGYYELVIKNIPANNDTLQLPNLRMVTNYSSYLIVEMAPDIEPDMKKFRALKKKIEEEYQLKILDETYEPTILDKALVFDLNEPSGTKKEDPQSSRRPRQL